MKPLLRMMACALLGLAPTVVLARPHVGVVIAPPTVVETPPPRPFAGAVWVEGYFDPTLGVWVPGHYVHPRPGWVYVHHGWRRAPAGWAFVRGHWHHM